jgi:hypothetical protein
MNDGVMEWRSDMNVKASDDVEISIDEVLEKLRVAQRPSRHAPRGGDLTAWRSEMERSALGWEMIGRRFMLRAAELREKIRAVDVLTASDDSLAPAPVGAPVASHTRQRTQELNPDSPPDLRHTRVLAARFADQTATGWNNLVHIAHKEAMSHLASLEAVRSATKSNLIAGRASSEEMKKGYRYVSEINVSIQNVDAGHAWSNTLRLARALNVGLRVDFEWMQKSDAMFPGERGVLAWKPR